LALEGAEVEGVTNFRPGIRPRIRIHRDLTEQPRRVNRLRTTLAHEFGHARFHGVLLRFDRSDQLSLFNETIMPVTIRCLREQVIGARSIDWMEWQAGYASGAFLMPISAVRAVVGEFLDRNQSQNPILAGTFLANQLVHLVATRFRVSADAAHVRLMQLGHLTTNSGSSPLPLIDLA
jgi:Zn-dependent peptidase ImmA (M78 family)